MNRTHATKCLDGETTEYDRVKSRRDERLAELELAQKRFDEAQKSFDLMEERIAFLELTLAARA